MLCLPFCACGSRSWRTPRKMRREQSQYLRTLRLLIYQCRSRRSVGRLLLPRTARCVLAVLLWEETESTARLLGRWWKATAQKEASARGGGLLFDVRTKTWQELAKVPPNRNR